jgi:hypothetical protein
MGGHALFGVASSLWLDLGAQRRHYNNQIKAPPNSDISIENWSLRICYWLLEGMGCRSANGHNLSERCRGVIPAGFR